VLVLENISHEKNISRCAKAVPNAIQLNCINTTVDLDSLLGILRSIHLSYGGVMAHELRFFFVVGSVIC
jgi:hypothetical protein